jgi:hypothetical protein
MDVHTRRRRGEPETLEELTGPDVGEVAIVGGTDDAEKRSTLHDLVVLPGHGLAQIEPRYGQTT